MQKTLILDPNHTAVLFVDFQEEQRADPTIAAFQLDVVLQRAKEILHAARAAGVPIFHAAYRRDYAEKPPRPFEPRGVDGAASFSYKTNPGIAICHEVEPSGSETVIYKNDASAFDEGSLDSRLRALGVEWLVMAGVWTEQCVAASVRDAMAAGFRVLIVKDACTSGTAMMHETAVLNLANRLYGGAVADTARTLAMLNGKTATVWYTDVACPIRFTPANMSSEYETL